MRLRVRGWMFDVRCFSQSPPKNPSAALGGRTRLRERGTRVSVVACRGLRWGISPFLPVVIVVVLVLVLEKNPGQSTTRTKDENDYDCRWAPAHIDSRLSSSRLSVTERQIAITTSRVPVCLTVRTRSSLGAGWASAGNDGFRRFRRPVIQNGFPPV